MFHLCIPVKDVPNAVIPITGIVKLKPTLEALIADMKITPMRLALLISINILWRSGRASKIACRRTQAQAPPQTREPTEETKRGPSLLAQ
jgi:hypothetical protein